MAFITDTRTFGNSLGQRLTALRATIVTGLEQRKVYRTTVAELEVLTNRELNDLGISRSMIKSIAIEAAYGK